MLSTPKALIFDLGKVLVPFDFERAYTRMGPLCGYPVSEIRRRTGATGLVVLLETGQISSRDFVSELSKALEVPLDYEQFREIWSCIFFPETLLSDSFLSGLKKRYPLVLLSNTNEMHFESLERNYPLLRHFEKRALSHEVGAAKPDPRIYLRAVELAGCDARECFFTDDIPEYVEAARKLGIDAVQFRSAEQLERDLAERGIAWD